MQVVITTCKTNHNDWPTHFQHTSNDYFRTIATYINATKPYKITHSSHTNNKKHRYIIRIGSHCRNNRASSVAHAIRTRSLHQMIFPRPRQKMTRLAQDRGFAGRRWKHTTTQLVRITQEIVQRRPNLASRREVCGRTYSKKILRSLDVVWLAT